MELRQYEARHPIGTKARLALDLLLYTAGRRTALGPLNMRNGRLIYKASKNDAELNIPIAEPLAKTIASTPMIGVKTFVTERGNATPAGFGNWFKDRSVEAGLPHCSAHDLRKAFLGRMAEAGCSEDFIASISVRSGCQQGEDGDGRHGAHAGPLSAHRRTNSERETANSRPEKCQLWKKRSNINGYLPGGGPGRIGIDIDLISIFPKCDTFGALERQKELLATVAPTLKQLADLRVDEEEAITGRRFFEFFATNIRNSHTPRA